MRSASRVFLIFIALAVAALPHAAQACATCFGQSDEAMARGMNMGIFTLLLVVTSVLAGIGICGIYLVRRAAKMSAAEPSIAMGSELSEPATELIK